MAEPLTSSDIIRERMGFGVSPLAAPETRRAYAAAGLSPLGTQERERFAAGAGISPMAGATEKEAWKMAEFQAGQRGQAPISYGGLGDRPVGSSRRAIRMQDEWDKKQTELLAQQQAIQQMEMDRRKFGLQMMGEERMQRAQDFELKKYEMNEGREARVLDEAGAIIDSIRGAVAPDGTVIANPIRPEDDDAIERLENLGRFKFGMENKSAQDMWSSLYKDALEYRQNAAQMQTRELAKEAEAKVGLAKDLGAYGMSITDFTEDGKINFVKANEAIGRAYAAGQEAKVEAAETKEEKKNITDKINSAEKELLKVKARGAAAQKRLESKPKSGDLRNEFDAITVEQGILEDEVNRLNRILGGSEPQAEEQPQKELSQQDQVALNWANANPDDPRAKRIKDKLGVQ